MKKKLTLEEFSQAIVGLEVGEKTLMIAKAVLVDRVPPMNFVKDTGLTKASIYQAIDRVWNAHKEKNLPNGYERVIAVLPEQKAYIVKKWSKQTLELLKKLESDQ